MTSKPPSGKSPRGQPRSDRSRSGGAELDLRGRTRRRVIWGVGAVAGGVLVGWASGVFRSDSASAALITVYRDPNCGCCHVWADILGRNGFDVRIKNVDDVIAIKKREGVPLELASCHTALVDGYAIEGHVPVESVKRLLAERPAVGGIAVPGMPAGSPGMSGRRTEPLEVIAFSREGTMTLFDRFD
ncbi:MAG TPA: DUF411 domain-containing protein [Alphaproteobacteria bacterium]|nr:DUF411 domain-containing protein [Alphaproteobacteria bacterium]